MNSAALHGPGATELPDVQALSAVVAGADRLLHLARAAVRRDVAAAGSIDKAQAAAHGLAWLATTVEAMRQLVSWADRLEAEEIGRAHV